VFENALSKVVAKPKEKKHRRGHFPILSRGISQGQGQPCPKNLRQGENEAISDELFQHSAIRRIAGAQSSELRF
jgi:hypothetical protein